MTVPPDFHALRQKQVTAHVAARMIATLVVRRGAVVQAGGCAGLWPLALSHYFSRVYTFEPDPVNFQCLKANVAAAPQVVAMPCALGETFRSVGLTRPKAGAGLWRVEGEGAIPMVPLDAVCGTTPIDALVLDVEGSEVQAWQGAAGIIATHRPLLWFEALQHQTALTEALDAYGYAPPHPGIGGDWYSVHRSRLQ